MINAAKIAPGLFYRNDSALADKAYASMKNAQNAARAKNWTEAARLFEQAKESFRAAAKEPGADSMDKKEWMRLASSCQEYEINAHQMFQRAPGDQRPPGSRNLR